MRSVWMSPAKLNLFLHITGRRADGYHELQTIFQFLNYSDKLTFESREEGDLILENPITGVAYEDNLIIRAATLLQSQRYPTFEKKGVSIRLEKKLPIGGGLGGGSSNAATTLLALNHLWKLNLSKNELQTIGLQLGADVPIFIHGEACFADGVGDRFSTADPEELWYLIAVPNCRVNTAKIFSDPALTRNSKTIRIRAPLTWEVIGALGNDCERVVSAKYPEVNQALNWLSTFGIARMTGTGCCVFSAFSSEREAHAIAKQRPDGLEVFVAKGVNKSPGNRPITQ